MHRSGSIYRQALQPGGGLVRALASPRCAAFLTTSATCSEPESDSPAPRVLPAGSLHPVGLHLVVPWWYNFTKKEGIGAMVDLHTSSMLVWNATEHLSAQFRKRVVDVLGACQERLGPENAMNARHSLPDGRNGVVSVGLCLWSQLMIRSRFVGKDESNGPLAAGESGSTSSGCCYWARLSLSI